MCSLFKAAVLRAGESFGELALLSAADMPRNGSAVVSPDPRLGYCALLLVPPAGHTAGRSPALAGRIAELLRGWGATFSDNLSFCLAYWLAGWSARALAWWRRCR